MPCGFRIRSAPRELSVQLSGGEQQRTVIAAALARRPSLIIADEPTTALDATVQFQILRSAGNCRRAISTAIILISHDLAVIASVCSRVYVMYAAQIGRSPVRRRGLSQPRHPYTRACSARFSIRSNEGDPDRARRLAPRSRGAAERLPFPPALPEGDAGLREQRPPDSAGRRRANGQVLASCTRTTCCAMTPILSDAQRSKLFPLKRGRLSRAPSDTCTRSTASSLDIVENETLALVGESGSGRTTPACHPRSSRADRRDRPRGRACRSRSCRRTERRFRATSRSSFRIPMGRLNPRMTVRSIIAPTAKLHAASARRNRPRGRRLLELVGLSPGERLYRSLSARVFRRPAPADRHRAGAGARAADHRRRRAGIRARRFGARADSQAPDELKREFGLSMLFTTHDLGVVRYIADRVAVMYLGKMWSSRRARRSSAPPIVPIRACCSARRLSSNPDVGLAAASLTCRRAAVARRSSVRMPVSPPLFALPLRAATRGTTAACRRPGSLVRLPPGSIRKPNAGRAIFSAPHRPTAMLLSREDGRTR